MRVIGLLIALFIVSCSTEKRATGEVTLANVTGEFNENGSPAISKSEDLSPVVPLLPATADKFVSRGVTLMPPEANGTYLVFCQEANTNQKVNLLDDVKPTRKVPANTPYAAAGYLKVEGNRFLISTVFYKNAKCDALSTQTPLLDNGQFVVLCKYNTTTAMNCETERAIYTHSDPGVIAFMNEIGFCNFRTWQADVTYDVTDRNCDQFITFSYRDSSTSTYSKSLSGNWKGDEVVTAKLSYEAETDLLVVTGKDGSTSKLPKIAADHVFATVPR